MTLYETSSCLTDKSTSTEKKSYSRTLFTTSISIVTVGIMVTGYQLLSCTYISQLDIMLFGFFLFLFALMLTSRQKVNFTINSKINMKVQKNTKENNPMLYLLQIPVQKHLKQFLSKLSQKSKRGSHFQAIKSSSLDERRILLA